MEQRADTHAVDTSVNVQLAGKARTVTKVTLHFIVIAQIRWASWSVILKRTRWFWPF